MLVVERDREALDLGLAGGEILDRRVGDRIGPGELAAAAGAGRVAVLDRAERAEGRADRGAGGRHQVDVGEVDIGEGDRAAVGEVAGGGDLLGDRADEILRGDQRGVIGAGDGDRNVLRDGRAVAIIDSHPIDFGHCLACTEILRGRLIDGVGPPD